MILTGLAACDNVSWGGVELQLRTPSPSPVEAPDTLAEIDRPPPPLEIGPALFLVTRDGGVAGGADGDGAAGGAGVSLAHMLPVALLEDGGLSPLPTDGEIPDFASRFLRERMTGREFVLFADGMRAGTFYPSDPLSEVAGATGGTDGTSSWCTRRPGNEGRLEVLPEAADVETFLALPADRADDYEFGRSRPTETTGAHRSASLNTAGALYVTLEILWPPSVTRARADVQAFRASGTDEVIAATFLYGDSLAVGPAPPNAYSLFFLGEPAGNRYNATYVRYREVGVDGKGAARFLGHFDWNRDGRDEVLLEVFGETRRWFAALQRDGTGWREIFEEPCPGGLAAASSDSEP